MRGQELGSSTGGVWTAADAARAGFSASRAGASGRWQVLRRGVYLDGGVVAGPQHRAWAAVLAAGGPDRAVATGRTAARLHGLPLVDDDDPATGRRDLVHDDVAVQRAVRSRETLHLHRLSYDDDELVTIGGCPVPSLLRTLWDLRLVVSPEALVCAVDAALHERRVGAAELGRLVARRRRHPSAGAFAAAVADAHAAAESPLETLTRLAVLPVLPEVEPQVEIRAPDGRVLARVDLGVRRLRLAVEADGRTHRGELSLARDRARERATGWTFERVTWRKVRCDPDLLRRRVLATAQRLSAAS